MEGRKLRKKREEERKEEIEDQAFKIVDRKKINRVVINIYPCFPDNGNHDLHKIHDYPLLKLR